MVTISNNDAKTAVRVLRLFMAVSNGNSTREVNSRRLASLLVKKIEKQCATT